MTLYELTIEWHELLTEIEEANGVMDDTLEHKLDRLTEASSAKVDAALDALANLEAQGEAQRAQAQRMAKRAHRTEGQAEVLRGRILDAVRIMGGRHQSARWGATLTTGRPAIVEARPGTIDHILKTEKHQFRRVEEKITLDKDALSKLSDEELEECGFRKERKPFLRIS